MIVIKVDTQLKKEEDLEIEVTDSQWKKWRQGIHIQEAMPHLTAEEREFLISGIGPVEWDILFGGLEE